MPCVFADIRDFTVKKIHLPRKPGLDSVPFRHRLHRERSSSGETGHVPAFFPGREGEAPLIEPTRAITAREWTKIGKFRG
jgi:hypothetical protein